MKTAAFVMTALVGSMVAAAAAQASEHGRSLECKFGGFGKDDLRCRVRIAEDNYPAAALLDVTPAPIPTEKPGNRVRLRVECERDFLVDDDRATAIYKGDDIFVLGEDREKTALVEFENRPDRSEHDRLRAALTLSAGKDFARRLIGECREDGDSHGETN